MAARRSNNGTSATNGTKPVDADQVISINGEPVKAADVGDKINDIRDQVIEADKELELTIVCGDFIDYLDSKTVEACMIVLTGKKIDHKLPKLDVCAVGKVQLKIDGKTIDFGVVKKESVTLSQSALNLPHRTQDMISNADLIGMKLEIEKKWCFGAKSQMMVTKDEKEKEKQAARKSKRQALANLI